MKYFIVILALVALTTADWEPRTREQFLQDRQDCFKSEKVPEAVIEKVKNRDFNRGDLGPEFRCYLRCLGVKAGTWDDEKGYDAEKSYKTLISTGFEVELENAKKCALPNTDNDDKCTWAAKCLKCMWDNKYITKKKE